jgi:hypothetical protein
MIRIVANYFEFCPTDNARRSGRRGPTGWVAPDAYFLSGKTGDFFSDGLQPNLKSTAALNPADISYYIRKLRFLGETDYLVCPIQ